jgi:glucose/arabinose dehydrogenase
MWSSCSYSVAMNNTGTKERLLKKEVLFSVFICGLLVVSIITFSSGAGYGHDFQAQAQSSSGMHITIPAELNVTINSGNPPSTSNFNIAPGYNMQPILWNLTLPDAMAFDDNGNMYVAEAGAAYGSFNPPVKILKVNEQTGSVSTLVDRFLNGPVQDIVYHNGMLYASHKGTISTIDIKNGLVQDIIRGLPWGDHQNNQLVFGPDGRMYFGIGTVTNSGVVGIDNYLPNIGWLAQVPFLHDIPAKNITVTGGNFTAPDVTQPGPMQIAEVKPLVAKITPPAGVGNVTTGAFVPFGTSAPSGQQIAGNIKCSGCLLSSKPDGTDLKLVGWGFREPYGVTFDNSGKLIVSVQGADERGSRPIANDTDKIYRIDVTNSSNLGKFYGYPDYVGGQNRTLSPVTDPLFQSPKGSQPLQFLMQDHPMLDTKIFASVGSATGISEAASLASQSKNTSGSFDTNGSIYFAEFGTYVKPSKPAPGISGQKIIKLDPNTGNFSDFISLKSNDTSFRPVGLKFSPDGSALYIASIAKVEQRSALPNGTPLPMPMIWYYPYTGVVWKVTHSSNSSSSPPPQMLKPHLSTDLTVTINSGKPPTSQFINLPKGYSIQPVIWNISIPTTTAFDDKGNTYVAEGGFAYGHLILQPRILKIDPNGTMSVFVDRGLGIPVTGLEFHDGKLYVSNGGMMSTIPTDGPKKGLVQTIIPDLPTLGDHYADQMAFGPDGRMYFGIGTVTNSGVVGRDSFLGGWATLYPTLHDIPGKNITLAGLNFKTQDYFWPTNTSSTAATGAYVPFGTPTYKGEVIQGQLRCSGCLMSAKPDGTDLKMVGWGFRHPYGVAFDKDGKLLASQNGVDERGSRPIANDGDKIWKIDVSNASNWGLWYGWPDFYGNSQPSTDSQFSSAESPQANQFVMAVHPPVEKPFALVQVGAAVTQIAVPQNTNFGYNQSDVFIGEWGTLAPQTHLIATGPLGASPGGVMGKVIGQQVIVLNSKTGNYTAFAQLNAPDEYFRPTGVAFSPDGKSLFITSNGAAEVRNLTPTGATLPLWTPWSYPNAGAVWKVTHEEK